MTEAGLSLTVSRIYLADSRPALDVKAPLGVPELTGLIDALLDDFSPFAIEEDDHLGPIRRVHFSSTHERDEALYAIDEHFSSAGVTATPLEIDDEGWAERSQASLRNVRVGKIVVAPPWDIPLTDSSDTLVIIHPSTGFGTGHHPSTRGCLRALQVVPVAGKSVLDLGTGSGVLAIAAVKLGATRVVGLDNDPDALASAINNTARNAVSSTVELYHCDIRYPTQDNPETASLIIANLTSAALCDCHVTLLTRAEPCGLLVLGGFTIDEEDNILSVFLDACRLEARIQDGEWIALILRRKSTEYQ